MASKAPQFKTSVDTYEDVSSDMTRINDHLSELHKFLIQFDWKKARKQFGAEDEDNGGADSGTKPPPKWP
jgi:hypothetical protein